MTLSLIPPGLLASDHIPTQSGKASDRRPEGEPRRMDNTASGADFEFEWSFFLSLGWPPAAIRELEQQARKARAGLIQTAIASGALSASGAYDRLSHMLSFACGNAPRRLRLPAAPAKAWLLLERPVPFPSGEAGMVALNGQSFSIHQLIALSQKLGARSRHLKIMTRQDWIDSLTQSYGRVLVGRAVAGLMKSRPEWSAKMGLAPWQAYAGMIAAGVCSGAACVAPREALTLLGGFLSLFFCLAILLRFAAVLNLMFPPAKKRSLRLLSDAELPRYTVLVPLFKEATVLPYLAKALAKLDYPPAKLDIKIVLEAADPATIDAASALGFPGNVDRITVPDQPPRTKPKALNYALQFATGELVVIYDAEDRPEPDQLRKAATAFHHAAADVACLQARLDYFNAKENWLSRQFTIEYAMLFRGLLPLLSRFGLPVPLGGTSNHFRIGVLRGLGAWDPYNVTEDADLGMRLYRAGYRVETLDSTTYEEACCQSVPWLKQRTRWLKGWMQTFGVHMRTPAAMLHETGLAGFLAFQAYFAGIIVSSLAHPLFYVLLAWDAIEGTLFEAGATLCDDLLLAIAIVNFIGGYAVNLALGAMSLHGAEHKRLRRHAIFIPVYWLYVSAAAYRAVWQLIRAPFYWEKTEHGVSRALKPAAQRPG